MKRKFLLSEAEAMGRLVRLILDDVTSAYARMKFMERRITRMEDHRTHEEYDVRKQYLDVSHAFAEAKQKLERARTELDDLGVILLDPLRGVVAFPFRWSRNARSRRIRKALFLLKAFDDAEKGIQSWRFSGEQEERRVPPHWLGQLSSPILAEVGR